MALITKQDTNGTKPLLNKGELGYDDYSAGGDVARVYVGRGDLNIPIAKQAETDQLRTDLTSHEGSGGGSHSLADTTAHGFMSSVDKIKLNGSDDEANNYILPASVVHETEYATSVTGGTIKARLDGTILYLRTDGIDA